jgi:hypothetical protein
VVVGDRDHRSRPVVPERGGANVRRGAGGQVRRGVARKRPERVAHVSESHPSPLLVDGKLDPYSSAILFAGWKEKTVPEIHIPPDYEPPFVREPTTWFLRTGWKLAKPISCWEIPG